MSDKITKSPQIRFAEFTDAWEEVKLKDCFTERSERSAEGELISVTINSGVVKASDLDRKDNSSSDKSNYKVVKVGDIAYNSMRMWQGASGFSPYNGILSPAYTVITPKENSNPKFFAYNFKRHEMISTFQLNSQGLTSDTWNLKFPALSSIKVAIPGYWEQTEIARFFEKLDYQLELHRRELQLLKDTKKSFLQKMFPKDGANVPEIRFAGFTDAWEQRSLSELGNLNRGKSKHRPRNDKRLYGGEYPFVQTGDVASASLYLDAYTQTYNEFGIQQSKLWNEDTLLITIAANIAESTILKIKAAFPDSIIGFETIENNVVFVKFALDRVSDNLRSKVETSSQANLNLAKLSNINFYIPTRMEQDLVSKFFEQLDNLITLHQRELNLLKDLKKSMLQQMFV